MLIIVLIAKLHFGRVTHLAFHQYKARQCIFPQASPREGVAKQWGLRQSDRRKYLSVVYIGSSLRMDADEDQPLLTLKRHLSSSFFSFFGSSVLVLWPFSHCVVVSFHLKF